MSTRSTSQGHTRTELPTTPEYLKALQQLVLRWGWKVTGRRDVIPTIVPTRLGISNGVPALFQPATAQIHVPEEAFAHLDASSYDNVDEFIAREPSLAGRFVHEFMHAAHSPGLRFLQTYHRNHDSEHIEALSTLLEGHCERQGWDDLRKIEQNALTTTVFDVVLESLVDQSSGEIDFKSPQVAANLLGLIAARVEHGIIDVSQPTANTIYVNTVAALGEYFDDFWSIATKFADVQVNYYSDYEVRMIALLDEWVDLLRSFVKDSKEDEDEDEDEQDGGEQGEDEGEGKGGKKPSNEQGEDEGKSKGGKEPGGEDEDEEESTGTTLSDTEDDGGPGFGTYSSANMSDSAFDPKALEDAVKGLREAAREQHENTQQMIKQNVAAIHEATAHWHSQRREWNRDWKKQWR